MKSFFRFFRCALGGILIGIGALIGTLLIFEQLPVFKEHGACAVRSLMENSFLCSVDGRIGQISLLMGRLDLKNLHVFGQGWSWQARHVRISFSRWELLMHKKLVLDLDLSSIALISRVDKNGAAIAPHIQALLTPRTDQLTWTVRTCILRDLDLLFKSEDGDLSSQGMCELRSKGLGSYLCDGRFTKGSVSWRGSKRFEFPSCAVRGTISAKGFEGTLDIRGFLRSSSWSSPVHIEGICKGQEGSCTLVSDDGSLHGSVTLGEKIHAHLQAPAASLCALMGLPILCPAELPCSIDWSAGELTLRLPALECSAKGPGIFTAHLVAPLSVGDGWSLQDAQIEGKGSEFFYRGRIKAPFEDRPLSVEGKGRWDDTKLYLEGATPVAHTLSASLRGNDLSASVSCPDLCVRIPHTYMIISSVDGAATYHIPTRRIQITEGRLGLYKGQLECAPATIMLDQSFSPSYAHIPLSVHDCFLHWKKDFFAVASGAGAVTYAADAPVRIEGQLIFDHSHLGSNLFSPDIKENFFGATLMPLSGSVGSLDAELSLSLATRSPLSVSSPFLEAQVASELMIRGSFTNPTLGGTIKIIGGELLFPYQPLYITRGKLYFLSDDLFDPSFELHARGTIKRYTVELMGSGTVRNPTLSLRASPSLREDQILGLLLGGSEDGSLALVMPTALTGLAERLLFGSTESASKLQDTLRSVFKPLKNVRLFPRFSDPSGRGGLRGALAIEFDERLRGLIQQNFTLTEDMRVEIEYDLSDDSRVRGVRDERGDVGVEFETGWKF